MKSRRAIEENFRQSASKVCNVQSALRFHHLFLIVFIFAFSDKFFHHKLTLGKQSSLKMRTKKNKNDEDDEDPLHHLPRKNWEKECALKCANISRTGFFVNAQGMKIRWYAWDASGNDGHGKKSSSGKDAKKNDGRRRATLEEKDEEKDQEEIGVVVGAHGSGAHAMFEWLQSIPMGTARNKYKNSWIERMNKKGLTFYAYDHQGAGRSECARGCKAFMERESDLVEDNARFMKLVRERHCGGNTNDDENSRGSRRGSRNRNRSSGNNGGRKKVFAAGVSMGGFVVARAAIEYPKLFADGVVLLCPMLSLKKLRAHASNRIILKILRLFSIFTPTWEVGKTHKNKKFPLCQKEMEDDPLCWPSGVRGIRARTASECYFGTVRLNKPGVIEKFTHPVIAFHSVEDPMTDCSGSESFIERCRSKDKTMVRCSDVFHHDLQHVSGYSEPIGEEMCQWLTKRA